MTKKAIVVGASGLIGSKLVNILINSYGYDEVLVLARKKTRITSPRLTQMIIEFEHLDHYADAITGDALFCCLGTTKNQTPNQAEYRKIDHDYPVELAKICLKNGVGQFHLVSSIGANAKASGFYLKTKGETEEDIKSVGIQTTCIYQPSLLTGRKKNPRVTERILAGVMAVINPLLLGGLKKYRSIPGYTVAMAMFKRSLKDKPGVFTYTSDKIKQLT